MSRSARWFAAAAVAGVAAVALAIVLVTSAGSGRGRNAPGLPAQAPGQSFSNPAIGVNGRLSAGWSAVTGPRFVQLRSPDGTAVIFIFSPGQALTASQLVATELASIQKGYTGVSIARPAGSSLGGLPAKSRVVTGRNVHGVPIRVLIIGARGTGRNYVLQAVTAERAPVQDLNQTQRIVQSLRLTG
jgi:hypothetical protein